MYYKKLHTWKEIISSEFDSRKALVQCKTRLCCMSKVQQISLPWDVLEYNEELWEWDEQVDEELAGMDMWPISGHEVRLITL